TDRLVRDLLDGDVAPEATAPSAKGPAGVAPATPRAAAARALPQETPSAAPQKAPTPATLEEVLALAQTHGATAIKVQLENYVHLVHLEAGKIEFRPDNRAPPTLAGDLAQKLRDWTGARWVVTVAREGGAATLAEQKRTAKAQRLES